jgi:short-subunit dehydrogenase
MAPSNGHCSAVLPGDIRTGFTEARRKIAPPEAYIEKMEKAVSRMEKDEQSGMSPDVVARVLLKTAQTKRPKARQVVGAGYKFLVALNRLLPYGLVEKLLRAIYL